MVTDTLIASARKILAHGNCVGIECGKCPKAKVIGRFAPCADNGVDGSRPVHGLNDEQREWFLNWIAAHSVTPATSNSTHVKSVKRILKQGNCKGISRKSCPASSHGIDSYWEMVTPARDVVLDSLHGGTVSLETHNELSYITPEAMHKLAISLGGSGVRGNYAQARRDIRARLMARIK